MLVINRLCYYLFLVFCCQVGAVQAAPALSVQEFQVLRPLMRVMMEEAELGYVLYNQKPICALSYFEFPMLFEEISFEDRLSSAIYCAKEVIEKGEFGKGNILFHFDEEGGLLVINRKLFLSVVEDNLSLFQYVLGPKVTGEGLLTALTDSRQEFFETLNNDKVLVGILFGFGVQNSLYEARLENLTYDLLCLKDQPPFEPIERLCFDQRKKDWLLTTGYDDLRYPEKGRRILQPSFGCSSFEEEFNILEKQSALSSKKLSQKNPVYFFGDFGLDPIFLKNLEATQEKIQQLLKQEDWFEKTLDMIYGEHVVVPDYETVAFDLPNVDVNLLYAKVFRHLQIKRGYPPLSLSTFAKGLTRPEDKSIPKWKVYASPSYQCYLGPAKKNLKESDRFFQELKEDHRYLPIVEDHLYYRVLEEGTGPQLKSETQVSVDLDIWDSFGQRWRYPSNKKMDLSKTIPGFCHGMQNMKVGERRIIYVHPSLAYGVHTYLDRGVYLKIDVSLRSMKQGDGNLPPLEPADLSFVKSEEFWKLCEDDCHLSLDFQGRMMASAIQCFPEVNLHEIAKHFMQLDDDVKPSKEECKYLHQLLWNHCFVKQ